MPGHRIIPFPEETIPGFELARLEWEYHKTSYNRETSYALVCRESEPTRACRLDLDEHNNLEGPPEQTFYASLEEDGGCFIKIVGPSEFSSGSLALSPAQVQALRILFSQEIPSSSDNQKETS